MELIQCGHITFNIVIITGSCNNYSLLVHVLLISNVLIKPCIIHVCCERRYQEGKSGFTLLHLAVKDVDRELFTYLLRVPSVDVNMTTYSRLTALDIADKLSRYDMVRQLQAADGQHSTGYVPDSGSESDDVSSL